MTDLVNKFGNFSSYTREKNDYYATHPSAVYPLFDVETFTQTVLEPACGEGHMSEAIKRCGKNVFASDLISRGYGSVIDFFDIEATEFDIITNPPYKLQSEFVEHAMNILRDRGKVALLLKIQFLESAKRQKLFEKYPPKHIYVFSKRARIAKNGDFENTGSALTCFAWFVWQKGFYGEPTVGWINPRDKEDKR